LPVGYFLASLTLLPLLRLLLSFAGIGWYWLHLAYGNSGKGIDGNYIGGLYGATMLQRLLIVGYQWLMGYLQ
jgi:hypothetical protein